MGEVGSYLGIGENGAVGEGVHDSELYCIIGTGFGDM